MCHVPPPFSQVSVLVHRDCEQLLLLMADRLEGKLMSPGQTRQVDLDFACLAR
jgi:hypothetical protein